MDEPIAIGAAAVLILHLARRRERPYLLNEYPAPFCPSRSGDAPPIRVAGARASMSSQSGRGKQQQQQQQQQQPSTATRGVLICGSKAGTGAKGSSRTQWLEEREGLLVCRPARLNVPPCVELRGTR